MLSVLAGCCRPVPTVGCPRSSPKLSPWNSLFLKSSSASLSGWKAGGARYETDHRAEPVSVGPVRPDGPGLRLLLLHRRDEPVGPPKRLSAVSWRSAVSEALAARRGAGHAA